MRAFQKKLRELNARTGSMISSRSSQIGTKLTLKYYYQKAKQTTATTIKQQQQQLYTRRKQNYYLINV